MSVPRLCRKLVLETPVRAADGAGGHGVSWQPLGTVWADVVARTGREPVIAGRDAARIGYRITVRGAPQGAPSRPRPEQRFREGGRIFNILAVSEADPLGRHLVCWAEEGSAS